MARNQNQALDAYQAYLDPFAALAEEIGLTRVAATFVAGRPVFTADWDSATRRPFLT